MTSRRTLIASIGSVGTVVIAGCSGGSESSPEPESDPEGDKEGEQEGSDQESGQNSQEENKDIVHEGEEKLEQMMSNKADDGHFIGGEAGEWIEFENPIEQFNAEETKFDPTDNFENTEASTTYIYIDPRYEVKIFEVFLAAGGAKSDDRTSHNPVRGETEAEYKLSSFNLDNGYSEFFENLSDYSDISKDFPRKYLNK